MTERMRCSLCLCDTNPSETHLGTTPLCLIVHIARWIQSDDSAIIGKNGENVALVDQGTGTDSIRFGSGMYALVGVVGHVGYDFLNGGHYVAWLRVGNNYVRADD